MWLNCWNKRLNSVIALTVFKWHSNKLKNKNSRHWCMFLSQWNIKLLSIRWFCLRQIFFKDFWVVRRFSVIKMFKASVFRVESLSMYVLCKTSFSSRKNNIIKRLDAWIVTYWQSYFVQKYQTAYPFRPKITLQETSSSVSKGTFAWSIVDIVFHNCVFKNNGKTTLALDEL